MSTTPGHANAIPGLANATHSEAPIVNIAGSAESFNLGRGAMQEFDQVGVAGPVTKGAWLVHDARRIPDMVATAVRTIPAKGQSALLLSDIFPGMTKRGSSCGVRRRNNISPWI